MGSTAGNAMGGHAMKRVVVATGNAHKLAEIRAKLDIPGWEFVSIHEVCPDFPDPVEDAPDFEGNARIKATAACQASGLAALADDSGLEVDALGGAPGVHSARYAGEPCDDDANNAKLLEALADVEDEGRTARFVSTLVLVEPDGTETIARGTVEGHIGHLPVGDHGFGYDPLFKLDIFDGERTMAQLEMEEKNQISHRGNALTQLRALILGDTV